MKIAFRILAPLVVLGVAVALALILIRNRPEPRKFQAPPEVTRVDATRLVPETFQVFLETQGTVRPRTTSTLIPEVSGRVIEVSPNFRDGGFFSKDEVLLRLDPTDYVTRKVVAESNLAQARRELKEEVVRGEQALENWKRLGKSGEPGDLAARRPQLAEAEARLRAAEAELVQAERDLERTEVRAPFDGRIIEQSVDVGQFVSSNTELARAFATDVMEVRLPLTNRQLSFIDLPSGGPGGNASSESAAEVLIRGRVGANEGEWVGEIVRVDSVIDESSRQLFVVAQIRDPYSREREDDSPELKIGMFVDARVEGNELEEVFVLPRRAVRVGGEVIVVESDNRIRRQEVHPVWSEEDLVVIPATDAGLEPGEVVCLTPLAYPANGALVEPTIDGVTPDVEQPGKDSDWSRRKDSSGKDSTARPGDGTSGEKASVSGTKAEPRRS